MPRKSRGEEKIIKWEVENIKEDWKRRDTLVRAYVTVQTVQKKDKGQKTHGKERWQRI